MNSYGDQGYEIIAFVLCYIFPQLYTTFQETIGSQISYNDIILKVLLPLTVNELILYDLGLNSLLDADRVRRESTSFGSLQHPILDDESESDLSYAQSFEEIRKLLSLQPMLFGQTVYDEWLPYPSNKTLEEWVVGSGRGVMTSIGVQVGPHILNAAMSKRNKLVVENHFPVKIEPIDTVLVKKEVVEQSLSTASKPDIIDLTLDE